MRGVVRAVIPRLDSTPSMTREKKYKDSRAAALEKSKTTTTDNNGDDGGPDWPDDIREQSRDFGANGYKADRRTCVEPVGV